MACLLWGVCLWAGPVTAEQARQKAAKFLQGNSPSGARRKVPAKSAQLKIAATGRDDSYYIFNVADNDGFVIVSGEDATEEILGYSDGGSINPENMPCGMRALLDSYSEQIEYIKENGLSTSTTMLRKARQAFHLDQSQLARFGQESPYNDKCPTYWTGNAINLWDPLSTGCAATAMAQFMYAHKWPNAIFNTIKPYTSLTRNKDVPGFESGTAINWSNIEQRYNDGRDIKKIQKEEIANLMLMAGSSVRMDYGKDGTESEASIISVSYALKQYFGYSPSLSLIECENFNNSEEWTDIICNELQKGYPVLYRAQSEEGGSHFFLLEGYDENEYFDINYGWEGHKNVSEEKNICKGLLFVKPGLEKDIIKYHINQDAIINVEPRTDNATPNIPMYLWPINWDADGLVYWRSEEDKKFHNMELSWEVLNNMPIDGAAFDHGIVFSKENIQQGDVIGTGSIVSSFNNVGETFTVMFSCGENFTDGFYKIHFVSKDNTKSDWVHADNFNNIFLNALVCNNALTIRTKNTADYEIKVDDIDVTTEGQLRVGKPTDINVTVKSTSGNYDGAIILNLTWIDENGVKWNCPINISEAHLKEEQSMTTYVSWVPFRSGELKVEIWNKRWETVGSTTINVLDADAMQDMLEVTKVTLENGDMDKGIIDGTYLNGSFTMLNHDEVTKNERILFRMVDMETGVVKTYPVQVQIAPDDSVAYNFSFTNLLVGRRYQLRADYISGNNLYKSAPLLCQDEDTGETIAGNEQLDHYEYWFDDDYAHREAVDLGTSKADVRKSIDTDQLEDGIHRLHFRVVRSDGWCSAVNTTTFLKIAKQKESHLDYWLDDDHDNVQTIDLANTEDEQELELNFADDTKFGRGNHRLNIQMALAGTVKGTVYTTSLLKLDAGEADRLEYWFDNKLTGSQPLTGKRAEGGESGYIYDSQLNMSALSPGLHLLNLRARSQSGGTLGSVLSTPVLKLSSGVADHLEYWFDGDMTKIYPLSGKRAEGGESGYIYDCDLDLSSLSPGLHSLSLRATSTDGSNKSNVVNSSVLKIPSGDVTTLEYWFDGDRSDVRTLTGRRAEGGSMSGMKGCIFTNELNLTGIEPGHHRLYYRGIGADGNTVTAVSTAGVVLKVEKSDQEQPTMASYTLMLDDETVVAQGTLDNASETVFTYTLDTEGLTETFHTLTATFWNSFGGCVTEKAQFYKGDLGLIMGDVNGDGHVDADDIIAIVNIMAGSDDYMDKADVNGDGQVDIGDIIDIINIMGGSQQ
jgi:hypothetical protein